MADTPPPTSTPATLYRSAIVSLFMLAVFLCLLWLGPPTETALARQAYLKIGFIYYPLMALLATLFACTATINIKQIICLKKTQQPQ